MGRTSKGRRAICAAPCPSFRSLAHDASLPRDRRVRPRSAFARSRAAALRRQRGNDGMSAGMHEFQSSFVKALLGAPEPTLPWSRQPGFDVYRNTVLRGAIDALAANVPSVHRLLGDDTFDAAAGAFVRARLPRDGRGVRYGAALPDFLASF